MSVLIVGRAGAQEAAPASPELRVLEKWIGTWDEVLTNKPTEWLPTAGTSTAVTKREWALDGKFVRAEGHWEPAKTKYLHLMTYDPAVGKYRSWYFDSANSIPRDAVTGVWDEKTATMTWEGVHENGVRTKGTHRIVDEDHQEWSVTATNRAGTVVMDLSGKSTRRKE
jgi:hypothetical protein